MDINKGKFVVDLLMFVDFVLLAVSGFILWIVFPAGEQSGRAPAFLFDRFGWIKIHDLTAVALVVLIVIHLILNWNWIKCMIFSICRGKNGR